MRTSLVFAGLCLAAAAHAETWPAKPVKVVSTLSAGSPADGLMRLVAQKLSDSLGQPVVVEVLSGAAGIVGAQQVARAAPDGYTFLHALSTTLVTTPHLMKNATLTMKDFAPVMVMASAATCMLGNASFAPNDVLQLIAYAKKNPGKVAYGSNGVGGTYHLEMEMLQKREHIQLTHVPYKGGTRALQAVVAGELPVGFAPCSSVKSQVAAGKAKFMNVLDYKRSPDFPDVPAMGEQLSDYRKIAGGVDFWAPAGTPEPILERMHSEMDQALHLPDVQARMKEISFPYDGRALAAMAEARRKDYELAGEAVKIAGLRPQ